MTVQTEYIPLYGGEDLVTPPVALHPARLLRGINYEITSEEVGYKRISGFERFDGQPAPSKGGDASEIASRRAAINKVTGEDGILGMGSLNDVVYAFRNAVGGATSKMYKSSGSGWTEVDLGNTISFTAGTAEFVVGETLTGGTSGATATIWDVRVTSGTWGGSNAAGVITIGPVTSGPYQAETGTSASGSATLSGAETAQTLAPDGRYECITANFLGTTSGLKMFGASGVDNAFQFDGTAFIKIVTGMTTDTPEHIAYHKNYLMLSFPGGSLQNSDLGAPLAWTGLRGAAELGIGDEITGLTSLKGGALMVSSENITSILTGAVSADFVLDEHSKNVGALTGSIQTINDTYFVSNEGITSLAASDNYGDFTHSYVSRDVQPYIDNFIDDAIASVVVHRKSQYRLFTSSATTTTVVIGCFGIDKEQRGFTRASYPFGLSCAYRCEISGEERIFMGSSDGYVYEADKGRSFDGEAIEAMAMFPYNNFKAPRHRKRYRKLVMEVSSSESISLQYSLDFNYGGGTVPTDGVYTHEISLLTGLWGSNAWDDFTWSAAAVGEVEGNVAGIALNVGLLVYSSSSTDAPHTLKSILWHYSRMRLER